MKKILQITLYLTLVVLVLSACTNESELTRNDAQPVTITLATTRAAVHSSDDFTITRLRILGYSQGGVLAFNKLITSFTDTTDPLYPDNIKKSASVNVLTGKYRIVFIANEQSDATVASALADNDQISTITKLQKLGFGYSAFDAGKAIPMFNTYGNVEIKGDNDLIVESTPIAGTWSVGLDRLAVRADIKLTLNPAQAVKWEENFTATGKYELTIGNVPQKVFLFADTDNSSTGYASNTYEAKKTVTPGFPGVITVKGDNSYEIVYTRLILPESFFADKNNATKAMFLQLSFGSGTGVYTRAGKFGWETAVAEASRDYTLPRSTYLGIAATVNDPEAELTIDATVIDWTDVSIPDVEVY